MDATKYFKIAYYSEVTFPKLKGLMGQIVLTEGEPPFIKGDILIFKITKTYAFEYLDTNKTHEIFKAQSCYEIPTKDIISKEDLYEFYKDAEKNMFTALNHFEQKSGNQPVIIPHPEPIENFQDSIDYIYQVVLKK